MRVGVKFCGNCNPHCDMPALLAGLSARMPDVVFVGWNDGNFDVLLVLNGCPAACATRPAFAGPVILVSSDSVDFWPVTPDGLPDAIQAALERHK